jgi:hypothetical protein
MGDEVISGSQGNFKPVAKRAVAFALALGSAYNIAFSIDSVDGPLHPLALTTLMTLLPSSTMPRFSLSVILLLCKN